jgi:hypothetical protein
MQGDKPSTKSQHKPYRGPEGNKMTTTINDVGTRIMNDHGVYPLLDTLTNDALLQTVCGDDVIGEHVELYVDAKGFHLVWRTVKRDRNGNPIWNGGNLLLETKSKDVTAEFAKKLDYDGEAPEFDNTATAKDDETWFITDPEVSDGYMFTLCGLRDDNGTHVTHVFATDGIHSRLLLAPGSGQQEASLEHMWVATLLSCLSSDDTTQLDTDADILSKAKEMLK